MLHLFRWEALAREFLERIHFKDVRGPISFVMPRHRRWYRRILHGLGRIIAAPFLWVPCFWAVDLGREYALEMEIDNTERAASGRLVIIAEVAWFSTGTQHCGRWVYSQGGGWSCLERFEVPLREEHIDRYEKWYRRLTGEDVKLPRQTPVGDPPG